MVKKILNIASGVGLVACLLQTAHYAITATDYTPMIEKPGGLAVLIIFGLIGVYFAIGILKDAEEEEGYESELKKQNKTIHFKKR